MTYTDDPHWLAACAHRDIRTMYEILCAAGFTQREIARRTGQHQSDVSQILQGLRRVESYDLLVRICDGLGIPPGYMGLAYDDETNRQIADDIGEDMKRRALMATASVALFGSPILGELLHIPARPPTPTPLPKRLGATDITALRNLTEHFRVAARTYGGYADPVTNVANLSFPLMSVPAAPEIKRALGSTLANLHTLAGWCCVDSGYHDHAQNYFAKAMELAREAQDNIQLASAFKHAGLQMIDAQAYNDGLKAFQLGLTAVNWHPQAHDTIAWLTAESALPLAAMGRKNSALNAIAMTSDHVFTDPFDSADMDLLYCIIYRQLGALDKAEALATSSCRKWSMEGSSARDASGAILALAELHVHTGSADAPYLANKAISQVATLSSSRARQRLERLATALDARPSPTYRELARKARQICVKV